MNISIIETSGLGDRSYLVDHGGTAVVIDPSGTSTEYCRLPGTAG